MQHAVVGSRVDDLLATRPERAEGRVRRSLQGVGVEEGWLAHEYWRGRHDVTQHVSVWQHRSIAEHRRYVVAAIFARAVAAQVIETILAPVSRGRRIGLPEQSLAGCIQYRARAGPAELGSGAVGVDGNDAATVRCRNDFACIPLFCGREGAIHCHRERQELARPVATIELCLVHARVARDRTRVHRRGGSRGHARDDFLEGLGQLSVQRESVGHQEVVVRVTIVVLVPLGAEVRPAVIVLVLEAAPLGGVPERILEHFSAPGRPG